MSKTFYVTTPIYYVNDIPHIGHAYTTVAADVLARYHRLRGRRVFFLTGTDEHGQKVEKAARERGRSPKEQADALVDNFRRLWDVLEVSNDAFIRTTDETHIRTVQDRLQELWERGEIERRTYRGWYCTPDERFWTEKDLVDGTCPDCGRPVEEIDEENYFFLMSKYHDRLIRHIEEHPRFILPETRRNEVLGFLKSQPLGDLCISRPKERLAWGVPLPFDRNYVTYVWFDALLNYYSGTDYLAPALEEGSWWPATHHIIGKDILTTHAVYWPTMLMAMGLALPENIFAHGWWTVEGKKMSKSLGNVVDPFAVAEDYGADAFRYFLLREVPFGLDGDFSEHAMQGRYNADLANDFGNLASRVLTLIGKYRDGTVPAPGEETAADAALRGIAENLPGKVAETLSVLTFNRTLDGIWELVSAANRYIETEAPWVLVKDPDKKVRLDTVLYTAAEAVRVVAFHLEPFIPKAAAEIRRRLGFVDCEPGSDRSGEEAWGVLRPGTQVEKGAPLFPRRVAEKRAGGKTTEKKGRQAMTETDNGNKPTEGVIGIEDFARVTLKVARVLEAERVPKSNKLLRLQISLGEETRQLVAGIGKAYEPDALVGKKIIVVANLKPAKLMGVESQGMLLAATGPDGNPVLLQPEADVPEGASIR